MTTRQRFLALTLGALAAAAAAASAACSSSNATVPSATGDAGVAIDDAGAAEAPGPSVCGALAPAAAGDLEVADESLLGYPPYATHDCTLVYVRRGTGALVARELGSGAERIVAPATEKPRRPTVAPGVVAWEATVAGADVVRVEHDDKTVTLAGDFDHAGEPRAAAKLVSFTAWRTADSKGDTDVLLFHTDTATYETVAAGAGQQRFSDVSETHVAVSDFSEDPDGRFDSDSADLADLAFYDLQTKTLTVRKSPGKDAFPVLASSDLFGYMHWGDIHPEPKFEAFGLRAGRIGTAAAIDRTVADVTSLSAVVQPSARGGTLAWVTNTNGVMRLFRAPADGSSPAAVVPGLDGLSIYAPASSDRFTVVATRKGASEPATLRLVPR